MPETLLHDKIYALCSEKDSLCNKIIQAKLAILLQEKDKSLFYTFHRII